MELTGFRVRVVYNFGDKGRFRGKDEKGHSCGSEIFYENAIPAQEEKKREGTKARLDISSY